MNLIQSNAMDLILSNDPRMQVILQPVRETLKNSKRENTNKAYEKAVKGFDAFLATQRLS